MSNKRYACGWCGHFPEGYTATKNLRKHVWSHHPEVSPEELERHIIQTRYPDLDIDATVQKYKDRLDTLIGLQEKGIFIKKYLATIGVLRHWRSDLAIRTFLKPGMTTAEEVTKAMADGLVNRFREASPEDRFKGYLNRDLSVLEKQGHSELIPVVKTLKTIKFVRKQIQEGLLEKSRGSDESIEDDSEALGEPVGDQPEGGKG